MGDKRKEKGRGRSSSCRRCGRRRKKMDQQPEGDKKVGENMAKPLKYDPCNPLGYLLDRQINDRIDHCKRLLDARFDNAENLFRKDLYSHYGCVNAIEFSKEGDLLVSGGDDKRVLLWNVEKAIHEHGKPTVMKAQHMSNIFCLGYNSSKTRIFSAGNDDQVIVHDLQTTDVLNFFRHEKPVYGLSVHPCNDNIFSSACDDGRVLIYDMRRPITSPESFFCLAQHENPFHSVMFNPVVPVMLATANAKEGVSMWDLRKPLQPVLRYGSEGPAQSCMYARFNNAGTTLLAIRRRLPPVLYAVNSPQHLCQFDHPGYYNSCTMKSCCFAGNNDEYILSGSDDFNLYMWKVPTDDRIKWVDSAHMILRGHRSIVNQVRYNPSSCLIASSGVEKIIKLWSPFPLSEKCSGGLKKGDDKEEKQRKVYTHDEYIGLVISSGQVMTHDYSHQSTDEDQRMMAFFDSLVQREIEGWSSEDEPSPQSPSEPENNNASEQNNASDSEDSTASDQQIIQCVSSSPHSHASSSAAERPLESPNRITRLIAYRREKLMRLALDGGSSSLNNSSITTYDAATSRAKSPPTANNREESASASEPETSAVTRSKSKKNKVAQKSKGVKRKHGNRPVTRKNGVRKKQNNTKDDSDSEPEDQPTQRQTRADKNNSQPVDGAQPSTSSGVVSSRRSRYTSTSTTVKPRQRQLRSSSNSSSEEIPTRDQRNASKRRAVKSDSDSSANEQQNRKSTRNKSKVSTASAPNNTPRDSRVKSKRQKVNNDGECNNHNNKKETATVTNGVTKETTPAKNTRNATTSDSGITSGVSTTEKTNSTAEKRTRGESSDHERIIKNLEWFRKKVETARRGYRKRAMLSASSDSSDE